MLRALPALFSRLSGAPTRPGAQDRGPQHERELNDFVRDLLRQHGDDGTVPRLVEHFADPGQGTAAPADAIIRALTEMGYDAREAALDGGVMFDHVTAVAGPAFDAVTGGLGAFFASNGWSYDRWGTSVIRKDTGT